MTIAVLKQLLMEIKTLIKNIDTYCSHLEQEFDLIQPKRKADLLKVSRYCIDKFSVQETPQLIVICTHNSRRSHLGQLWLAVAADFYGLPNIATYSGGTEATALNERIVTALKTVGFDIHIQENHPTNPRYAISWTEAEEFTTAFSKRYDNAPNPTQNFAAIMVCTDADENCPIVSGMDFRLGLPYEDPKAFDDTPQEAHMYSERCQQIAREMLFIAQQTKFLLEA